MPCDPLRHQTSSPSPVQRPCSPGTPFFRHTLTPLTQSHSPTHMHRPHHTRHHSHSGVSLTQSNSQTYPITHIHTQAQTHTYRHTHTCTYTQFALITSSISPTLIHIHIHILKHFGRLNCTLKIHVHPESDMEIHSSQI